MPIAAAADQWLVSTLSGHSAERDRAQSQRVADWVENQHGLHHRKAVYWIKIYDRLSNSGVPWAKVPKLGWTKRKEIAKLPTIENVEEWVQIASAQNTNTLIETVKNALAKNANPALEDQTAKTLTTKTFKMHDGQRATIEAALAKAKETTGTAVNTVALKFMAIDNLGSMSDDERIKVSVIEKLLKLVEKNLPEYHSDARLRGRSITPENEGEAMKQERRGLALLNLVNVLSRSSSRRTAPSSRR
jgi:hypothetical protein